MCSNLHLEIYFGLKYLPDLVCRKLKIFARHWNQVISRMRSCKKHQAFDAICRINDHDNWFFCNVRILIKILIFKRILLLLAMLLKSSFIYKFLIRTESQLRYQLPQSISNLIAEESNKLLTSFSVCSQRAKWFNINEHKSPNVINCLNGISSLSIF